MNTQKQTEEVVLLATKSKDLTVMLEASIRHEQEVKHLKDQIALITGQRDQAIKQGEEAVQMLQEAKKNSNHFMHPYNLSLTHLESLIADFESIHNSDEDFFGQELALSVWCTVDFFVKQPSYDGRFDKFMNQLIDLRNKLPY